MKTMSTTTNKIDPTVTLDKLIALLQGFKEKLGSGGNSDTISRVEALGDEETQSKYYNKFGGGRALAGAILEVDGNVDKCATKTSLNKKADDLKIVLGEFPGNLIEDTTIEGIAAESWENVPPEFEVEMSASENDKLWQPGASFAIPHPDTSIYVDFPITGWKQDETDSQKLIFSLRPFYASDGKLVRGTVEVEMLTSNSTYKLHFKWEYAQTAGGGENVIEIPMDVIGDRLCSGFTSSKNGNIFDSDIIYKFNEALQGKYADIRFCSSAGANDGAIVSIASRNCDSGNGKVIYTGPLFDLAEEEMVVYLFCIRDDQVDFMRKSTGIRL